MLAQLIQRQVPLGSKVTFSLKSGRACYWGRVYTFDKLFERQGASIFYFECFLTWLCSGAQKAVPAEKQRWPEEDDLHGYFGRIEGANQEAQPRRDRICPLRRISDGNLRSTKGYSRY